MLIDSFTDISPGVVRANTNIAHGYSNSDRIIQENSSYDGEFTITNVSATSYDIGATYIGTSIGFPAKVELQSKASNEFSGANKNTSIVSHDTMSSGDIIFIVLENVTNSNSWLTDDIQLVFTKV